MYYSNYAYIMLCKKKPCDYYAQQSVTEIRTLCTFIIAFLVIVVLI